MPSTVMSEFGQHLLDRRADAVEIARDGDVEAGRSACLGIEEEHVGLADRDADDVGAARGAHDGVGDLGIGDQHILDVARQVDDDRLADAERHRVRSDVAGRDVDGCVCGSAGSSAAGSPAATPSAHGDQAAIDTARAPREPPRGSMSLLPW